jgi:antibiotic biosynthesis monooxygenase (ABM) superfamily enzyme
MTGILLTALVFYPIITGQPVESLPELSRFGIDAATELVMKETVSSVLYTYLPCEFEG